jgi:hypothetical protein
MWNPQNDVNAVSNELWFTYVVSLGWPWTTGAALLVNELDREAGVVFSLRLDSATARKPATLGEAIDVPERVLTESGPSFPVEYTVSLLLSDLPPAEHTSSLDIYSQREYVQIGADVRERCAILAKFSLRRDSGQPYLHLVCSVYSANGIGSWNWFATSVLFL